MAGSRTSVVRLTLTGALSTFALYVTCWLAAVTVDLPVTHMLISLFTPAELTSLTALGEGGFWSFFWGGFAGAVIGVMYNLAGFVDRRAVPTRRAG